MAPRYKVTLTKEERLELEAISTKGKRAARTVLSARALLLLDAGDYGPKCIVAKVAEAVGRTTRSLEQLKKRFVEEGLAAAIERKKRETPPREIQFRPKCRNSVEPRSRLLEFALEGGAVVVIAF